MPRGSFHGEGHLNPGHLFCIWGAAVRARDRTLLPTTFCCTRNFRVSQNVSQNRLSVVFYLLKNRDKSTQCFKKINPSRQRPKLWFQHPFMAKALWVRLQIKAMSVMAEPEQSPNPKAFPRPSWLHSAWKMREVKLSELVDDPEGWDKQSLPLLMMVNPCDVLITEPQCPHRAA